MHSVRQFQTSMSLLKRSAPLINSSTLDMHSNGAINVEPKEVQIEVPWGHVAGKWYGPKNLRPILMLHGWQDNAGTFDTLVPLLPKHIPYLAIDLPGHGFSSRLPHGMLYSAINYIHVLNIIKRHYGWDQLSFCSHSMGAHVSTLYASLYPEQCDLLIALDAIMKPYSGPLERRISLIQKYGDEFLSLDKLNRSDNEPPTYTYNDLVNRWTEQTEIDSKTIEHLARRGVCQSKMDPNRFYFSRDIRLKLVDFGHTSLPDDIHYKIIERISAPHLFIKANKSTSFEGTKGNQRALDILKANNPKFEWICVNGGHHCHLTDPKLISEHVSNFINKHRSSCVQVKHKL